jgi:hypothetical protein
MSRKGVWGFAVLVAAMAVSPALAGCDNDGNGHPAVNSIFGQLTDPNTCNEQVVSLCNATLISPTVAITSAECAQEWATGDGGVFNLTATWLSNDPNDRTDCASADRIASYQIHPSFDPANPESAFNIGVIVLAAPSTKTPASLPAAGAVDLLSRGDPLDAVSYVQGKTGLDPTLRLVAPSELAQVTAAFLKIKKAPGGSCTLGDGGSGVFSPGGQAVLGMNIDSAHGNWLRLDIPEVRDFLDDYVTVP